MEGGRMLTLSRRIGEAIVIEVPAKSGPPTRVAFMVTEIYSGQVKVGIAAPDPVIITREELLERPVGELASLKRSYARRCEGG